MPYVPFTYQERPVSSAKLNANFGTKADLDPVTGKVQASQLPDGAAIAHEALDAEIAAAAAAAAAAQGTANSAATAAATAEADAQAAHNLAVAAKAEADAAIPLAQKGAASGVATLNSGSKVPLTQLPYTAGTNVTIDGAGVISATGGGSSGSTYTPPISTDFPIWINRGVTGATDTTGALVFTPELVGAGAGNLLRANLKIMPSGDFDKMIVIEKGGVDWPFFSCGVCLEDSSTGKRHTMMSGAVFFDDPANSSLSGDRSGINELYWSDANTVSDGRGMPYPASRMFYRITRVSGVTTISFRRTATAPWIGGWGVAIQSMNVDRIGISCLATCYGGLTNYPYQTFQVLHYGDVI